SGAKEAWAPGQNLATWRLTWKLTARSIALAWTGDRCRVCSRSKVRALAEGASARAAMAEAIAALDMIAGFIDPGTRSRWRSQARREWWTGWRASGLANDEDLAVVLADEQTAQTVCAHEAPSLGLVSFPLLGGC